MSMQIIVLFEFSQVVCGALRELGYEAWSCDKEPTEGDPRWHIQGDAFEIANSYDWFMAIAHPPCTYLCNSGLRWLYKEGRKINGWDYDRCEQMHLAAEDFNRTINLDIPLLAVENPRMHPYAITECGQPDQYVQLWQFGDNETKETGFRLKRLPKLVSTEIAEWAEPIVHNESPGPERTKNRSRTRLGIAKAMATQWGRYAESQYA